MPEQKQKILIVEDERPMAKALELKLGRSGYEARAVHNGEDALTALRGEAFDLMILDLVMPKLDGFGVLTRMQEEEIDVPAIVLSNLGQEEDAIRARTLGARDFFVKSNTPIVKVVEHVKNILG